MGQKIHPNGLRLGIVQDHLSTWFENKTRYSKVLNEDFAIRRVLKQIFEKRQIQISDIKISRYTQNKTVLIYISTVEINKLAEMNLVLIQGLLKKSFGEDKTFELIPEIVEESQKDANLMALKVVSKLRDRVPFKRAMKDCIQECYLAGVLGIKIQVSGRLNGVEIARSEWKRQGRVPLHTLQAKIKYSQQVAHTIYGIIGVKVWIFLGEDQSVSKKFV